MSAAPAVRCVAALRVALLLIPLFVAGPARADSGLRLRVPTEQATREARVYDVDGMPVGTSRVAFRWVVGRLHMVMTTQLETGERSEFAVGLAPAADGWMTPEWQRTRSYDASGDLAVEALIDHRRSRATCREDGDWRVVTLPPEDRVANVPLDLVVDPLAAGEVDEVHFQFLFCRGFTRLFEATARRRDVLETLGAHDEVAEIEVNFDLGMILTRLARPFLPRIQLWMTTEPPVRWLGHRMPLFPSGPVLLVLGEDVTPAELAAAPEEPLEPHGGK